MGVLEVGLLYPDEEGGRRSSDIAWKKSVTETETGLNELADHRPIFVSFELKRH